MQTDVVSATDAGSVPPPRVRPEPLGRQRSPEDLTNLRLRACERAVLYGDLDLLGKFFRDGLEDEVRKVIPSALGRLEAVKEAMQRFADYEAIHGPASAYDATHPIAVSVQNLMEFLSGTEDCPASPAKLPLNRE